MTAVWTVDPAQYLFQSEWRITADIERLYEALLDYRHFSEWWPSIRDVELISEGDAQHVGARARYSIRSPLMYSLRFEARIVELVRPTRITIQAVGDLSGTGTYLLGQRDGVTSVTYLWDVATTKTWMNVVAPIARPLFVWAHHSVMREGGAGVAHHLGGSLLGQRSQVIRPEGRGGSLPGPTRNGFGTPSR